MRVAAMDIGTNTVLLLVAEQTKDGLVVIEEHATITRLGEGVDKTRKLAPAAIARNLACFERYADIVKRLGVDRIAAVGTSALRDAEGREEILLPFAKLFGAPPRVISGDDEARLTFQGALSGLPSRRSALVFDIGGGSTEVVRGTFDATGSIERLDYCHSFDLGSVRLTERWIRSDPPAKDELSRIWEETREALAPLAEHPSDEPIGIAGTVTTLAAVSLGMSPYDAARIHGHVLTRGELRETVDRLASLPLSERVNVPGLEPKRADVIVAGGILAVTVLEAVSAERVLVSDRGVRWGLAAELAAGQA